MAAEKERRRRLEWLGHVARMPAPYDPKVCALWLAHPHCGPRRRWKYVVRKDLKDIDVEESEWYTEARRSRGR